ncbi:tetratricopeptide repeat protein [Aestuariicoccus sp. MJ-SS9]|uniref:tetratricopeptide repeat protein n=1 Tax=Aestuariicoccus sp. MJ-SS9 TaxID=3079855 RepID=UPI002905FDC8|nr:tetratricopeptide repeat protein [Aestuariicoccus sp. MJ-SS9]MDU8910546.1 tetratricopeptide repeat protein [Aestuariicoccus sp. MJ-SS9]
MLDSFFLLLADLVLAMSESLRMAATDPWFEVIWKPAAAIFALLLTALAAMRQLWRLVFRIDSKVREDMRAAQRACAEAQRTLKETEARVDALRLYDPKVFLRDVRKAAEEGVIGKPAALGETYVQPLAPALARAYTDIAREALIAAPDRAALEAARRLARGAFAAHPQAPDVGDVLEAIDEAAASLSAEGLSAEEREAWALSRQGGNPVAMVKIGQALLEKGRYRVAQILLERGWTLLRQTPGPEAANTLWAKHAFAACLGREGKHARAMSLFTEVWEVMRRPEVLGPEHSGTLNTAVHMAFQRGLAGQAEAAVAAFEEVWAAERTEAVFGPDHPRHLYRRYQLARLKDLAGDLTGAEELLDGLRDAMLARFAPTHQWIRELDGWTAGRTGAPSAPV